MRTSLKCIGLAVLVFGAVGQKQYRPAGSSSSFGGGSSGSSSGISGSSTTSAIGGSSSGVGGGSSGGGSSKRGDTDLGSSNGGQFNSPDRPGSSGGFGGGNRNQGDSIKGGSGSSGESLEESLPGVPGDDYPIYSDIPETSFSCDGQVHGGYYADTETECQVFHICVDNAQGDLTKFDFICPNGTIFDQQYLVCSWWFNVDCSLSEELFSINNDIAEVREAASSSSVISQSEQEGSQSIGGKNGGKGQGKRVQSQSSSGKQVSTEGSSSVSKGNGSARGGAIGGSQASTSRRGGTTVLSSRKGGVSGSSSSQGNAVYQGSNNKNKILRQKGGKGGRKSEGSDNRLKSTGGRTVASVVSKKSSNGRKVGSQGGLGNGFEGVGAPGFGGQGGKFAPKSGYGAPGGTFGDSSDVSDGSNSGSFDSFKGNEASSGSGQGNSGSFGGSQSISTGYGAPPGGSFDGSSDFGNDSPLTSYSRNSRDIEYFTDYFTDVWKLQ